MLNASIEIFTRLVRQKHANLTVESHQLLRALSGEDIQLKKNAASAMLSTAENLKSLLTNEDRPAWLVDAASQLGNFVNGAWQSHDLLLNYIPIQSQLQNHIWVFDNSHGAAFDFDAIYERYKAESRLPELFSELVRLLEDIHASGEIDSLTMLNSLTKVIATLKRGKDGSYFSLNSAWSFLISFLKNYMWAELSKVPVLGTVLTSLQKTIEETDAEMVRVHNQVEAEMATVVAAEIKPLAAKAQFPFVTYGRAGQLALAQTPLLTSIKA